MRAMIGDSEPEITLGTILFIGGLLFVSGIIFVRFTEMSAIVKSDTESIENINIAHMIKKCLEDPNGNIVESSVSSKMNNRCLQDSYICIKDLVTDETLPNCRVMGDYEYMIHISLQKADGKKHLSELYVKQK